MLNDMDRKHLKRCVELAREAVEDGDEPFGSLLVSAEGIVLAEDRNRVKDGDHTQHPEFNLARWAASHMSLQARQKATMYTSGEHCPMCAAAHGWVQIGRNVYASSSKQLEKWLTELGGELSRVKTWPVEDVIRDTIVEGPDLSLAEEIFALHKRSAQNKKGKKG